MTTPAENALLTQTGPNTPMGDLFRRYWIPMLLASELPEPDCPPVRVKLLSESLVAFRETSGKIALLDEFCAHRRVSLWFGRNEENGIRCPYHGWKYDSTGQCVDIPSEEPGSKLCDKVKLKSYPCIELGGVIWTYMGPEELQPPVPEFEWATVPDSHRYVNKRWQECNYLQAMEGGVDSSHVSSLHSGELHTDPLHKGTKGAGYQADTRPKFEIAQSDSGLLIGAKRAAGEDESYWRVTQWIMPWYTMIPPYGDHSLHGHAWVPMDDDNCVAWNFTHHPGRELSSEERHAMENGQGIYADLIPGTFRTVANKDNDYLIDRAAQKTGRYYSGVKGIAMQDASLQESMGPVVDRSLERLVSTDVAIVHVRRRLGAAAKALAAGEAKLAGLDPQTHHVRPASFVAPRSASLADAQAAFSAREGLAHTSI